MSAPGMRLVFAPEARQEFLAAERYFNQQRAVAGRGLTAVLPHARLVCDALAGCETATAMIELIQGDN